MRADQFEPVDPETAERWSKYGNWEGTVYFPSLVGLQIEELRTDYCRMRLPFRPELNQPAGLVHGGALATLVDSVVVPAVGQRYDPGTAYMTLSMNLNFVGAVREADAVAEGWVTKRGRTTVFCRAEVTSEDRLAVEASLVYAVRPPR